MYEKIVAIGYKAERLFNSLTYPLSIIRYFITCIKTIPKPNKEENESTGEKTGF